MFPSQNHPLERLAKTRHRYCRGPESPQTSRVEDRGDGARRLSVSRLQPKLRSLRTRQIRGLVNTSKGSFVCISESGDLWCRACRELLIEPVFIKAFVVRRQARQDRSSQFQYVDRTLFLVEHFSIGTNQDGIRDGGLPLGIERGLQAGGIVGSKQ